MCSAMLQQVRYTDDHDLRFQCSKNLDMYSDYMKRIRFADVQESRFQCAKRSYMCCALQ